jgi:hypothetical protein
MDAKQTISSTSAPENTAAAYLKQILLKNPNVQAKADLHSANNESNKGLTSGSGTTVRTS